MASEDILHKMSEFTKKKSLSARFPVKLKGKYFLHIWVGVSRRGLIDLFLYVTHNDVVTYSVLGN